MRAVRIRRRVCSRKEIDGERDFLVGHQVPAETAQFPALHAGDADSFPTQARSLPGQAFPAPRNDRVEADEDEQACAASTSTSATGLSGMWVERSGAAVSRM